jgi:hypothetical protein
MKRNFLIAVLLAFSFSSALAEEVSWTSKGNVFVVSYQSELQPLQINQLHAWILHIENADGEPVADAVIEATGGMPVHDHGLPTRPRVTDEIGDGNYRLEGIRFHMAGLWEITLVITDGDRTDTVVISLTL